MPRLHPVAAAAALAAAVLAATGCKGSTPAAPEPVYPEKDRAAEATRLLSGPDWYRHAVFYEVDVRSFQDSNGDGIGDLPGLTSRLDALRELGVDALWLMPIYPSPLADSGYDVADHRAVHPDYGTMADLDALLAAAHARGMRVMLDLVLNHTSVAHPWFQESRRGRAGARADWYEWSDAPSRPDIACQPIPTFGTSAWTWDDVRGQYYFHLFYPAQPDLDYRNPEVADAMLDVARSWLERGVDGFRCDAVGLLYDTAAGCYLVPETLAYFRRLRALADAYPDRALVAEPIGANAPYLGDGRDMFHLAFDFGFAFTWPELFRDPSAQALADHFAAMQQALPPGGQNAIQLGNHDLPRAHQRTGGVASRWRRAALVQLTMPGTPFLYYGEELALRQGTAVVVDGRDGARTPMPWTGGEGHGFSTAAPWLPFAPDAKRTSVEAERADPASELAFYRALLALRRGREAFGTGSLRVLATDDPSVLLYLRESADESYAVAVALDERAGHVAVAPGAALPGDPRRLFGDAILARQGTAARVALPPAGMGVFRVR
jgi:alpha-glucosidase